MFHINASCYVYMSLMSLNSSARRTSSVTHSDTVRQDATGNTKMRGEEIQHVFKEPEGHQMYAGGLSDHTTIQAVQAGHL